MLTTKRYEYLDIDAIRIHPALLNHRPLDMAKVAHYRDDILKNGLLEPLVVWEKGPGEFYLAGGFHRMAAIRAIRQTRPSYFDRVDVRVVAGDSDEIRALNLKLNADRVDARIVDYFDTVVYLHRAGWSAERIAGFLDRPAALIRDIIGLVPGMDARVRAMLEDGRLSWNRARVICRTLKDAPAGRDHALERLLAGPARKKPLTFKKAKEAFTRCVQKHPQASYELSAQDMLALLLVLEGKHHTDEHIERVQAVFPEMLT